MTGNKYIALSLMMLLLLPFRVVASASLWFIFDERNEHHRKYVEESEALLRKALPDLEVMRAGIGNGAIPSNVSGGRTLLVSVGLTAARKAAEYNVPTVNTLITRRSFDSLKAIYTSVHSSIYLDQPVNRQLQLVKSALPSRNKMTVLIGRESQPLADEITQHAEQLGIELRVLNVDGESAIDELFGAELLAEDTLLLLPDPEVVNRRTVKPLVMGSYRQGIPLVGYSQALVKAGALMAVHSSLPALEKQLLEVTQKYFKTGVLPDSGYADSFAVSVNYQLARALKISLPSEASLEQTLQEQLQ